MKFTNILGKGEKVSIENIQSDFVTIASHQLRTPLSAIKWYAEMLLNLKKGDLNEKQIQYLKEIYRSNERAINLVNDLLDVSRIQEGHIHLELRPTKVERIVEEIIDSFNTLIRAGNVTINFEIINGPMPDVICDREKLRRVIINLLSNSIKYTPARGKIRITLRRDDGTITFTVEDTGVGIPKGDQKKIFRKFFRSGNIIKLSPDGTGLGLYIAKSLIEVMGGQIGFESKENIGTKFYVNIPLKP